MGTVGKMQKSSRGSAASCLSKMTQGKLVSVGKSRKWHPSRPEKTPFGLLGRRRANRLPSQNRYGVLRRGPLLWGRRLVYSGATICKIERLYVDIEKSCRLFVESVIYFRRPWPFIWASAAYSIRPQQPSRRDERMGKYAPVLKAAECGSMTRAAQTMGYTQPSLGYIINNIEKRVGRQNLLPRPARRDAHGGGGRPAGYYAADRSHGEPPPRDRPGQQAGTAAGGDPLQRGSPVDAGDPGNLLPSLSEVVVKLENEPYCLTGGTGGQGAQAGLLLLCRPVPLRAGGPAPL